LEMVLSCVQIATSDVPDLGELQMELRYLPKLFSDLSYDDAIELLHRVVNSR
jgi:hypothetical protein